MLHRRKLYLLISKYYDIQRTITSAVVSPYKESVFINTTEFISVLPAEFRLFSNFIRFAVILVADG